MSSNSYVIITPARDEEANIERLARCVIAQTHAPERWVVVSDGSRDRTEQIVQDFAAEHPWIELLRTPGHDGRHFAAKVDAFNLGYARVRELDYEVIGNLDADVSFDADYFAFLMRRFGENPALGVAGTAFVEGGAVAYNYAYTNIEHVSGQCQMFRRACFEQIGGYVPIEGGGIDWVAVTSARMMGWQTRTFTERHFVHHRRMGSGNATGWRLWLRQGRKDYSLGNHPLWQVFRCLYQMKNRPRVLGGALILAGYLKAAAAGEPRPISRELTAFARREQMARLKHLLRGGAGRVG